jgi:hypothetical protein
MFKRNRPRGRAGARTKVTAQGVVGPPPPTEQAALPEGRSPAAGDKK